MKVLGLIPARCGSKWVPRKNVRPLGGKPLIAYTIETALQWGRIDDLIVSTDDDEIAQVAASYGARVPFERPPHLATDTATAYDVVRHATEYVVKDEGKSFEIVIQLDPTSPLRQQVDLERALEMFLDNDLDSLYSVCHAGKNPYFNMVELDERNVARLCMEEKGTFPSRQTSPAVYEMNGSIYIYRTEFLLKEPSFRYDCMVYVMPRLRSIDIDTEADFLFAELLIEKGFTETE